MTRKTADQKLKRIRELAEEIENDRELKLLDERYSITAKWIDTDIDNVDLD